MAVITSIDDLKNLLRGKGETTDPGGYDRGGFYLAYFNYIMDDATKADADGNAVKAAADRASARQVLLQAEITTYSGFAGGAALIGNALAKNANPALYPATLDIFSYKIADGLLQALIKSSGNGSIEILPAASIQDLDLGVWTQLGMGEYFPGNLQFAGRDVNTFLSAGTLDGMLSGLELTLGEKVGYRAIDKVNEGGTPDTSNPFYDIVTKDGVITFVQDKLDPPIADALTYGAVKTVAAEDGSSVATVSQVLGEGGSRIAGLIALAPLEGIGVPGGAAASAVSGAAAKYLLQSLFADAPVNIDLRSKFVSYVGASGVPVNPTLSLPDHLRWDDFSVVLRADGTFSSDGSSHVLIGYRSASLTGSSSGDILVGFDQSNLQGGSGNDLLLGKGTAILRGGMGNDVLVGTGDTRLYGEAGNDALVVFGNAIADGGDGNDIGFAYGSTNISQGFPTLLGGAGNDTLLGYGIVSMDGGDGNDLLLYDNPSDATSRAAVSTGAGNDTVAGFGAADIYLGSGPDLVLYAGPGSEIHGAAGHQGYQIDISRDTRLFGLNPTDRLSWAGITLTGGVRYAASDDPWAYSLGGLFRYGINDVGDLVIQTPTRFANDLGWISSDSATYVAGYINGDAKGSTNATARIYTVQFSLTFSLLLKANLKPGWIDNTYGIFMGNLEKAYTGHSLYAGVDPLVLDIGGKGLATSQLETGGAERFDINGDGFANPTGWIGADQGFLVHLDTAPDGRVTSINQLFGSSAVDGFEQLAVLDTNKDGVIDASDQGWAGLRVWQDANGNHVMDTGELLTMEQAGVTSISLAVTPLSGNFQQGNQIRATATFTRTDGTTGTIADVMLHADNFNSTYLGTLTTSQSAEALPDIKGRGTLLDLRAAMSIGEAQGTDGNSNPVTAASPLEIAVTTAISQFSSGGDMNTWRQTMLPVLQAWTAALPDPKVPAPGWWTQTTDANGKPIQGALTERPDIYVVVKTDANGNTVVDDLEYTTRTVTTSTTDPTTGIVTTSQTTYGYWAFGSGRAVTDAQGNAIVDPTLDQARQTTLNAGESWSVIRATELDFLERYMGETLHLGQSAANHAGVAGAITSALNTLNGFLDLVTLRLAVQAPALASIFGSIQYNIDTDTFTAKTDLGLVPMYEAIFETAPAGHDAAVAYLQHWSTVIADLLPSFDRGNGLAITDSFLLGNIVAGWESAPCGLTLTEAAGALGCDPTKILTGTDTIQGASGGGDLIYVGAGVSMVQNTMPDGSGGKPETFVVGRDFDNVTIDQSEGILAGQSDILRFASFRSTDIIASRDGTDLILATKDGLHTLRIEDQFVWDHYGNRFLITGNFAERHGVTNIIFADGVTWDAFDIGFATAQRGTSDQLIQGTSGHEVLIGGSNDTLEGGGGENIYVFQRGFGHDTIQSSGDDWITGKLDSLMFGPGISQGDLVFARGADPKDLLISISGTQDSVLIRGQFDLVRTGVFGDFWDQRVDMLVFADGSTISGDELIPLVIQQEIEHGDSSVFGSPVDDRLDAGPGDRYVSGGDGTDVYVFGRGYGHQTFDKNLTNILSGGNDTVEFGPGIAASDLTVDAAGSDLIIGIRGTSDQLTIISGVGRYEGFFDQYYEGFLRAFHLISTFTFADGSSISLTDLQHTYLTQGSADGDTSIVGFASDDTIVAGPGDRYLSGGTGSDTYIYSSQGGNDTIDDRGGSASDRNTLLLSDLTLADISVRVSPTSGSDLVITILPTGKTINIEVKSYPGGADIDFVQFADGTMLTRDQLNTLATTGTPSADTLYGTLGADVIDGQGGGDYAQGNGGGDTYVFDLGYGQLEVKGTNSDELRFGPGIDPSQVQVRLDLASYAFILTDGVSGDQVTLDDGFRTGYYTQTGVQRVEFADGTVWSKGQIIAAVTANMILGTTGSDTLVDAPGVNIIDGLGGGDIAQSSGAFNTFIFKQGYGQLEIRDNSYFGISNNNILKFGPGITIAQITAHSDKFYNLYLTDSVSGDQVIVDGQYSPYYATGTHGISSVQFDDGFSLSAAQLGQMVVLPTTGPDGLFGTNGADTFDGKGAPVGSQDFESGGGGGDTFIFNRGYGQLEIFEEDYSQNSNILEFGPGITSSDIVVRADVSVNFHITDGAAGDEIILDGQAGYPDGIQAVVFADGSSLSAAQLVTLSTEGTTNADAIYGSNVSEALDGKGAPSGSQDYLNGNGGNDTFVFNEGYGRLEIDQVGSAFWGSVPNNTLQFGDNITAAQLTAYSDQSGDLIIDDGVPGDEIRIHGQLSLGTPYRIYGIQSVGFADGSSLTLAQLAALANSNGSQDHITGTTGSDVLYGWAATEVFDGKGAPSSLQDFEKGGGGADTFIFNAGYGQLEVSEDAGFGNSSNAVLQFGPGITAASLSASLDTSGNLYLTDGITGDQIKLDLAKISAEFGITQVQFDDGSSLTQTQLLLLASQINGTSGSDYLFGTSAPEVFDGKGAPASSEDYVSGGGGADIFVFKAGYGQLEIREDAGFYSNSSATLQLGAGINSTAISVTADTLGNLTLTDSATGNQIKLDGQLSLGYGGYSEYGVAQVQFADGTIFTRQQLATLALTGTTGSDVLYGNGPADVFDGKGAPAGLGDFELGTGAFDTFIYNPGYGQLGIYENAGSYANSYAILEIGGGINATSIAVSGDGAGGLFLRDGIPGDQIDLSQQTLAGYVGNTPYGISQVQFSDGTALTRQQLATLAMAGTTGADFLNGSSDADILDGKGAPAGSQDTAQGNGGADTFVYNLGYGHLEVGEYAGYTNNSSATLLLGVGITSATLSMSADTSGNLYLADGVAGDQVELDNQLNPGYGGHTQFGVAQVQFADGTVLTRQQLAEIGTSGADSLYGTSGGNVFDGRGAPSGSQDYEQGNGGADTFIYQGYYGQLEINDDAGTGNPSTAVLLAGYSLDPTTLTVDQDTSGNILLSDGVAGDQIKIDGMGTVDAAGNAQYGVGAIRFANAVTWTGSQIRFLAANGTQGSDDINGSSSDDVLDGRGGTDIIRGGGGNDTYLFHSGYGSLTIDNSSPGGTSAQGQLALGQGLDNESLWFSQSGNDLVINRLGSSDAVNVSNWFGSDPSAQLAAIKGSYGLQITGGNVTQLEASMATYQAANPTFNPSAAAGMPSDPAVQSAIQSYWSYPLYVV